MNPPDARAAAAATLDVYAGAELADAFAWAESDAIEAHGLEPATRELREALLAAQYEQLGRREQGVMVVIAGIDGVGKGGAISQLTQWMDPRHVRVLAFGPPTSEEAIRPPWWRYWDALPGKGRTGVVFGSWYAPLLAEAARKRPDMQRIMTLAAEVRHFEALLAAEGIRVVKLWFHLSRAAHAERTKRLLANPDTAWQVSAADLKVQRRYKRLRRSALHVTQLTQAAYAPWRVVPCADDGLRVYATGQAVLDALRRQDEVPQPSTAAHAEALPRGPREPALAPVEKSDYEDELLQLQARLAALTRHPDLGERALVLVFEGRDAAGKGSTIRRLTPALDARQYTVHPIAAPEVHERLRPYLWRFWRRVPMRGKIAIFDRSWYGRVLVERVEALASRADWQRAYGEINDFERHWTEHGIVMIKFWLSVSKAEQLRRFKEREASPLKQYKITEDDWRNRERWRAYTTASRDMLARTHTQAAPWVIVPSDDKRAARLHVLRCVVERLEAVLGRADRDGH